MDQWAPDPETQAEQRSARVEAQARAAEAIQIEATRASQLELTVREIEQNDAVLDTAQIESVLAYHCGDCHRHRVGGDRTDGLFFDRFEELIEIGKVIPGDAAQSRLLLRVWAGEMPPASSSRPPVPEATVSRIADFIDALPPPPRPAPEPAWAEQARDRPDTPPVAAPCFEYLGDWIRCEHAGEWPSVDTEVPGRDLERCFQACRERADCVAVTDYTWLELPDLGCSLYLASCATPGTGVWHEEDGARQYRKLCTSQ